MKGLYNEGYFKGSLFFLMFILTSYQIIVLGQSQNSGHVSYGGEKNNGDGSYTFTYIVTSGAPIITKFRLYSSIFESGDVELSINAYNETIDTDLFEPSWILYVDEGCIEFIHESDYPYGNGTTIVYQISIDTKSYTGNTIGDIDYQIDHPPAQRIEGKILGPIAVAEIIDINPWYQQLPVILVPVFLVIVGILAYRNNWI